MKNYYEKGIKGNECLESRLCKRKNSLNRFFGNTDI